MTPHTVPERLMDTGDFTTEDTEDTEGTLRETDGHLNRLRATSCQLRDLRVSRPPSVVNS